MSVQSVFEAALARLAEDRHVASVVAGRTDAGVHAAGQVAHLDLERAITPARLRDALNFHLKPHPVAAVDVAEVAPGWSARFSAVSRRYRYVILDRVARPALLRDRAWHLPHRLDVAAMSAAANHLTGRHDFTSFRASACQAKSPVRTLDRLEVARDADLVVIEAEGRSFLHHPVRNMVGTLALVGRGRWRADQVAAALAARDRAAAGPTAPANGLCLMAVRYAADPFA